MDQIGRVKFPILAEGHTPTEVSTGIIALAPNVQVPFEELSAWLNYPSNAGTPASIEVTVGGTWAKGDIAIITLRSNSRSESVFLKSFKYTAQIGDTPDEVAAGLADAINYTDRGIPFSASVLGAVITITADEADVNFLCEVDVESVTGTLTAGALTPVVVEIGTREQLEKDGIHPESINESTHDLVVLTFTPNAPVPFIDTIAGKPMEVRLYLSAGEGATFVTLLDGL